MGRGATARPVDALAAVSGRLTTPTVAREALDRYPWPLLNRIAGYITICAAIFSTIFSENLSDRTHIVVSLVLGAAFLVAMHLLSGGLAQMPRYKCIGLAVMQVVCALILFQLVNRNATGPLLLLFTVAAELQFLVPMRIALLGTAGLWVLALGTMERLWAQSYGLVTPQQVLNDGASTLTGFIFVVAFTRSAVTELIQRHQATILLDELYATHARLQSYVHQVEELTVARERNRLAREIHDTLGHYLTVINVQIETAQKLSSRDPARSQEALATAKNLASECLAEVRRSVEALRPAALDGVALPEAIAGLVDDLRRATGVTIHVEGSGAEALSPAVEVVVYRVIQEALTNVRRHAQARNVWLRTTWGPTWFTASVRDDGRGASTQKHSGDSSLAAGFGMRGMRERVAAVGGTLDITTAPDSGFCVELRVPCSLGSPGMPTEHRWPQEAAAP